MWIGYDPAKGTQNGDSAGCVVVAPPAVPGGKFRILERHQWRGMDFRAQADAIKKLTEQYNVTYIGIDSTGVGHGVYENVKAFFPAVREFVYNPNVKNALVLKAYDIISHRRLEFDAGHTDIAQSFMAIRRATTASGNRPTYEASRSEEKPATPIWPGQRCTHCLTNRCRVNPPIPAILWRFFDGKE
ncbi:hypothetical protein VEE68_01960 [Escherichia coli]|nr:hypothetical protein VEE68_01960 [Escherichia coli]